MIMMKKGCKLLAFVGVISLAMLGLAACGEGGQVIEPKPEGSPQSAAEVPALSGATG